MSAIKQPAIGSPFSTAAEAVNRNFDALDRRTNYTTGGLRKGVMGTGGDSISGYATGPQNDIQYVFADNSPIQAMRTYRYCADFVLDSRDYYTKDALGVDDRLPVEKRGHGFAKGSTSVAHFLNVQVPYILESPPEFLFVSTNQNGGYWQDDQTLATKDVAMLKEGIPRLLDAGITILHAGILPHSNVGGGTNSALHKHRVEHEMQNWGAKQRGYHYMPTLDAIKAYSPDREAEGIIDFAPGTSNDGLHVERAYGAWLLSAVYEPHFRKVFPEYVPPVFELFGYDQTFNPYGNWLGAAGAMVGTGGLFNGVANAAIPAGVEVSYDTGKGVTLTPSLVTRNGRQVLHLEQAGTVTPTGDGAIRIAVPVTKALPGNLMEFYAEGAWVNAKGWGGLQGGGGYPVRNSTGGVGGNSVMPITMNRPWRLLTARPRYFANNANNRVELAIDSMFISGVPFGGAIEVDRMFFGRSDNDI